ncbi:MAG: DUF3592 domain-containing protein [Lentisphaeria bacterium]|nr:DUF3592 domain-containing protein [Lentisphaeria bacterium]
MKLKSKTFFSQTAPPVLLGGFVSIFTPFILVLFSFEPDFPGWTAFLLNSKNYPVFLPLASGIALFILLFSRIRIESDHAKIYSCTFFPSKINYSEVINLSERCSNPKFPTVPTSLIFQLRSGKYKIWGLNLFAADKIMTVKAELERRINTADRSPAIPDIRLWANNALRPPTADKVTCGIGAIFVFGLAIYFMCAQLVWDRRIETWDKVDGIILKNDVKTVSRGKGTREIADVEYQYVYQGRTYRNTRIVYDDNTYPAVKVGTKRQVIVNPDAPQDSAVMFKYVGHWGLLIRYGHSALLFFCSAVLFGIFIKMMIVRKIEVPSQLISYIAAIPLERFLAAAKMEKPANIYAPEMNKPMEYLPGRRYGIIKEGAFAVTGIIWIFMLLPAVAGAIFNPGLWIIVVMLGAVCFLRSVSNVTVFDFYERKFFRGRKFDPQKTEKLKFISFSEIDHLSCRPAYFRQGRVHLALLAVKHDGSAVSLCQVSAKHLNTLLELLPELAEKMGKLPIIY